MVAEEGDEEMGQMSLPDPLLEVIRMRLQGEPVQSWRGGDIICWTAVDQAKRKRCSLKADLAASEGKRIELEKELRNLRMRCDHDANAAALRCQDVQNQAMAKKRLDEHQRRQDRKDNDHAAEMAEAEARRVREVAAASEGVRAARDALIKELGGQVAKSRSQLASALSKLEFSRSQVATQTAIASRERDRVSELRGQLQREMQEERDEHRRASQQLLAQVAMLEDTIANLQDEQDRLEGELGVATAGPGRGRHADATASDHLEMLKIETGIRSMYVSPPPRARPTTGAKAVEGWARLSIRHMTATIKGRGEGDDIENVAIALDRCGYLERLTGATRFQRIAKQIVTDAVGEIQNRWSARHAVHVWDRLELSRRQMETLSHLLSFEYDAEADKYGRCAVWTNPHDATDVVNCPVLASREAREKEYAQIAAEFDLTVGANGRVERDFGECTTRLYTNYAAALRPSYSAERPAQPVLFLDGTGGALGRGITHGEVGCADFRKVGDEDVRQSRATLQPLFLYEGTDHGCDQRANLELSIDSYNRLVAKGYFDCLALSSADPDAATKCIPCRPMTAADMQGAKATYGQLESTHSVWCKCQKRSGGPQHRYATEVMESWEEMERYVREEVGCTLKTFEDMCAWAHYSPGVARGGAFTRFKCSCCGYNPTEAKWRADLAAWRELSDEDQAAQQQQHQDADDPLNSQQQHYHQRLFMPPLPHHGMERAGVDHLHLVFLNIFKHLFKYTIHEGLPKSKIFIVREYCKRAGFYSYDAASVDEDPVKHWIGREVKRFVAEAHLHVPFLLQLAAAPADCVPEMAAFAGVDGAQAMELDDEYAPTEEEVAAEEAAEPLMMANAARWDRFLALVRAGSAEWPQGASDTNDYRKSRGLEWFNLMNPVARDIFALKPTMESWVFHIACFIVPFQMLLLGDPSRRSCDACESFGAMVKKVIKHSTCRRRLTNQPTNQTTQEASQQAWKKAFTVGFIEQAFRRVCVRESLQHGKENLPFQQRADARRTAVGRVAVSRKVSTDSPIPPMPSVYEAAKALQSKAAKA